MMLVATLPKSGTHLLYNILKPAGFLMTNFTWADEIYIRDMLEYDYLIGHIYPTQDALNSRHTKVFLNRNPLDMLVSWKYHNDSHEIIRSPFTPWQKGDYDGTMMWLIRNIKPFIDEMTRWQKHADYILDYEKLIDFKNVGYPELEQILDDLNIDIEGAKKRARKKHKRYRTGGKDNWEGEFTDEEMAEFERIWLNS